MALDKDILGQSIYDAVSSFNNKDINATGDMEAARLAFCRALANAVISHFKTYGSITGNVATTGTAAAQTGSIVAGTGKIQ